MRLTIKMALYATLLYIFILCLGLAYHSFLSNHNGILQTVQVDAQSGSQVDTIYIIAGELVAMSIIGFLEVRHKIITKLWAWLQKIDKKLQIAILSILFVLIGGLLWYTLGWIIAVGFVFFAALIAIVPKQYRIIGIASMVFLFPALYLLLITFGIQYSLFIYFSVVFISTYLLSKHKTKNILNMLTAIVCITTALMFGLILYPILMLALLVIVAVYDYISVFKTKHMQLMAGEVVGKLPVAFFIGDPGDIQARLARAGEVSVEGKGDIGTDKRTGTLLGGGDVSVPMAVAMAFLFHGTFKFAVAVTAGACLGIWLNMALLNTKRFKFLPAIPLIALGIFICLGIAFVI